MLGIIICLVGVLALLVLDDFLAAAKIIKAEYRRKFAHITIGIFVASWPWLTSWRAIQAIAVLMILVVALNQWRPTFKFNSGLARTTYGDYFFAIGILLSALLTTSKVFFMVAMLQMGLADAVGAIVGKKFGIKWKYSVLNNTKTIIGSMAFWVTSLIILGAGTLFAHQFISFSHYILILVFLPPILTLAENLSVYGLDNLIIPVVVILALRLAQGS